MTVKVETSRPSNTAITTSFLGLVAGIVLVVLLAWGAWWWLSPGNMSRFLNDREAFVENLEFRSLGKSGLALFLGNELVGHAMDVVRPIRWEAVFQHCSDDGALDFELIAPIVPGADIRERFRSKESAIAKWKEIAPGSTVRFRGNHMFTRVATKYAESHMSNLYFSNVTDAEPIEVTKKGDRD